MRINLNEQNAMHYTVEIFLFAWRCNWLMNLNGFSWFRCIKLRMTGRVYLSDDAARTGILQRSLKYRGIRKFKYVII